MKFSKSLIGIAAFAAVSVANAGPILIVSGLSQTSEVGTTTAVMNNLQALQVAAGNTVTILDTLPVNLAPSTLNWTAPVGVPTAGETSQVHELSAVWRRPVPDGRELQLPHPRQLDPEPYVVAGWRLDRLQRVL